MNGQPEITDFGNEGAIGVFDSGVGGLTVLRELRAAMPGAHFVYLGDTARLPYGTKSAATVVRYSLQCAAALVARRVQCLVVACNTASASALDALRERYPRVPIVGVIEPGAAAAVAASIARHVAVIGTEGTIAGGAYQTAIHRLDASVTVTARACALFVAMAEEGWTHGPIAEAVARRYLEPLFSQVPADSAPRAAPDTLVIGCTHFPALARTIAAVVPAHVQIVDSAATTAAAVLEQFPFAAAGGAGRVTWLATDGAARFARVSGTFLGETLRETDIELIDL